MRFIPSSSSRRAGARIATVGLLLVAACASGPRSTEATRRGPGESSYPPRPPDCRLAIVHASTPGVAGFDDLGREEVICHMDVGAAECMRLFHAEACRRGADIVYDVPAKPLRPREQAIAIRGRLAHSAPPSSRSSLATRSMADAGAPADASSGRPETRQ